MPLQLDSVGFDASVRIVHYDELWRKLRVIQQTERCERIASLTRPSRRCASPIDDHVTLTWHGIEFDGP